MAAIDKIYVKNNEQYKLFIDWVKAQPPLKDKYGRDNYLSDRLYDFEDVDIPDGHDCPVFKGEEYEDAYIIRNCPFDFIQNRLKEMYGSSYDDIKEGKMYASPSEKNNDYEVGCHFKLLKKERWNWRPTPKKYDVEVHLDKYEQMRYCNGNDTWNFWGDYIHYDKNDYSDCRFGSIKAIMRRIPKWKLPVGAIVRVDNGRMNYVFQVKK